MTTKPLVNDVTEFDQVGFIMAFEDGELDDDEIVEGFQGLIDTGIVWKLQGIYGRIANQLIDQDLCSVAQ